MISRSISCLWITFCLHVCCYVDSGEAQNAKEGKFLKFGLSSIPLRLQTCAKMNRNVSKSGSQLYDFFFFLLLIYITILRFFNNIKKVDVLCTRHSQMRPVSGDDSAVCSRAVCERPLGVFTHGNIILHHQCAIGITSLLIID